MNRQAQLKDKLFSLLRDLDYKEELRLERMGEELQQFDIQKIKEKQTKKGCSVKK